MTHDCPYNVGVICDSADRHCATCGWNPKCVRRPRTQKPARCPKSGPTCCRRVAKVDARGRVIEVYSSITMAAKQNFISNTAVRARCLGKLTTLTIDLGGCTFKYLD